jgi:hypothetical protein
MAIFLLKTSRMTETAEATTDKLSAPKVDIPPAANFPPMKDDRLLRIVRGERVESTPAWIMRQAGRYLPGTH